MNHHSIQIPPGWKLVPYEPTPAMAASGFSVNQGEHDPMQVYRTMIQKAPVFSEAPHNDWPDDLTLDHIDRLQVALNHMGPATCQALAWVCAMARRQLQQSVPVVDPMNTRKL